jgi:hypothetical protein
MGKVKLDRPAATRLQVDEQQPLLRAQHVARMRLAVQQLLGRSPIDDRAPQAPQRVAKLSNYGREGATAFTAKGRHFGVTVDRDSDSMLSRSPVADGRRARHFAGRQGYLVRVLGTAGPPLGFDWHGHSNESSAP